GTKIAIAGTKEGEGIYVMNADGTGLQTLILGEGAGKPDWQPVPNKLPIIKDDVLSLNINTTKYVDVLANDVDEELLNPSNLTIHTSPSYGTASIVDGKVKYTP